MDKAEELLEDKNWLDGASKSDVLFGKTFDLCNDVMLAYRDVLGTHIAVLSVVQNPPKGVKPFRREMLKCLDSNSLIGDLEQFNNYVQEMCEILDIMRGMVKSPDLQSSDEIREKFSKARFEIKRL